MGGDEAARLPHERLGPIGPSIAGGLDEEEGWRGREQVTGRRVGDGVADHRVRLGPEWEAMLRLGRSGLALGVVERPLMDRDDPLPGRFGELLAELDRLGQDDLPLGGQEGDAADLPEVHPDRVVQTDRVGRERLELLGGRLGELPGAGCLEFGSRWLRDLRIVERGGGIGGELARLGPVFVAHADPDDNRVSGRRGRTEIGVGCRIRGSDRDGADTPGATAG